MMTYPWLASGASITSQGVHVGSSFPETKNVRYPTPGTPNPEVKLYVVDISNLTDIHQYELKPPSTLDGV